jgi:hypothetical protein
MSLPKKDIFRNLVRELIKKEIDEANSTATAGGQYNTPHSFKGSNSKGKKKKKAGYQDGHEDPTIGTDNFKPKDPKLRKESVNEDVSPKGWNMSKKYIRFIEREVRNLKKYHRQQNEEDFLEVANYIELQLKQMKKDLNESVNEEKKNSNNLYSEFTDAVQDFNDRCIEIADKITKLKGDKTDGKILMRNVKKHLIPLSKLMYGWNKGQQRSPHLTTEGRYHAWRNDDSMTPKQKIGMAMRETRDNLTELERVVKYNVKLKNELKVDSRDYWKTTHKALSKISERLVRLANKVGQLH